MSDALSSAHDILAAARQFYAHDAEIVAELGELEQRLSEPLRVALVGSVKAGKSTLLNGLLGERIAPTDSRECTRIVTWYRYGKTPQVKGRLVTGGSVPIPSRRQQDRLELDLQGLPIEKFERLDVTWPAPGINGITLIDTPGVASISEDASQQTNNFLLPEQGAAGADAVIYLLRSLHETDVRYLRALNERTRHGDSAIPSIAVLSRVDELGTGNLTAMLSVTEAVDRLRKHPDLEGVCETVVPVAGLMGMGAMSLRQSDFVQLQDLAGRDPDEIRRLLLSGERFIAAKEEWLPAELSRIDLVDRFGMYGVRMAVAVLRGGIADAGELSAELLRRSGLDELRRVIDVHFTQRQSELKAHSIVLATYRLVREHPLPGSEDLLVMADEHMTGSHTFVEMHFVGRAESGQLDLPPELVVQFDRIVGGRGSDMGTRLGVDGHSMSEDELLRLATQQLAMWRELGDNPLQDPKTVQACRVAARSCESIVVTLMDRRGVTAVEL